MAPIDTGVPSSSARPQTFHRFSYIRGGGQLTPLAQKLALLGTMATPGGAVTGKAGEVYDINSSEDAAKLFGDGSELHCMVQQAYRTQRILGRGPRIVAVGAVEPADGAKATFTLTFTGPAKESKNLVVKAIGRRLRIGVSDGHAANTVAAAVKVMFDRYASELPFTATVAANVVTCTYRHKGTNGNDLKFSIEDAPKGIAVVVASGVAGAGALDLSDCYLALEGLDVDGFSISPRSLDDVEDVVEHVTAMWQPAEKRWRWGFIGDNETLATATALGQAANDRAILVGSCEGSPSMPFEIATSLGVGALSRERPNANYDGMELPIYPPATTDAYNGSEVEAGIAAGLTILTPIERGRVVVGDRCKVERMVTTKTTEAGLPFLNCRDLGVPRAGAYLARQLDIRYVERFGANANPDGVLMDDAVDDRIRDMVAALWHEAEAQKIIRNVEADLAELVVQPDDIADGRMDVETAQTVVLGMHQVAYHHRVKVGG